jgi:hypothetical protein
MSTTTSVSEFFESKAPLSGEQQPEVISPAAPVTTGVDSYTATQLERNLLEAGSYSMTNLYSQTACPSAPGAVCRASNVSVNRAEELARRGQTRQKNIRDRLIDRSPDDNAALRAAASVVQPDTTEGCTSSTLKGFQMSSCPPALDAQIRDVSAYNAVSFYD